MRSAGSAEMGVLLSIANAWACSAQRQQPSTSIPAERKDSPAAAAKPLLPRADLAIGKPQHPGHEQRQKKQSPHHRLGNKHEAARIPARIERKERPHAVIVGPVEQQMAERRNKRSEIEPAPVNRLICVPTLFIRVADEEDGAPSAFRRRVFSQRSTSHTAPTTTPATTGTAQKVCVMPRWCFKPSTGPAKPQSTSRSAASAASTAASVA